MIKYKYKYGRFKYKYANTNTYLTPSLILIYIRKNASFKKYTTKTDFITDKYSHHLFFYQIYK